MSKSSKAITLALIGSASVVLIGTAFLLSNGDTPAEEEWGQDEPVAEGGTGTGTTHRGGGIFIAPRIGGFGGGAGRAGVAPAPSARGGFGSTGSASVGS